MIWCIHFICVYNDLIHTRHYIYIWITSCNQWMSNSVNQAPDGKCSYRICGRDQNKCISLASLRKLWEEMARTHSAHGPSGDRTHFAHGPSGNETRIAYGPNGGSTHCAQGQSGGMRHTPHISSGDKIRHIAQRPSADRAYSTQGPSEDKTHSGQGPSGDKTTA